MWTAAVNLPNSATVAYRYLVLDKAGRVVEGAQLAEEEQGGGEMQVGPGSGRRNCLGLGCVPHILVGQQQPHKLP